MKLTLRQFINALYSIYILDTTEYNEKAIVFFNSKDFLRYCVDTENYLDAAIEFDDLIEFRNS